MKTDGVVGGDQIMKRWLKSLELGLLCGLSWGNVWDDCHGTGYFGTHVINIVTEKSENKENKILLCCGLWICIYVYAL